MTSPDSTSVSVRQVEPSLLQDWDDYVQRSGRTVFAHQSAWARLVERNFDHKSICLLAYRDGVVVGMLSMFLVDSKLFGKFLTTSPFLTYGGLVGDDEQATTALIEKARLIADELEVDYIELRNDRQCSALTHTKTDYCNMVLDLSPGPDVIWRERSRPSARRNVRRARKEGLELDTSHANLETFVNIYAQNMHRLGTPTHGRQFFENIVEQFPDADLLLARKGRKFIAGMLLVPFKNTILMPWTCSLMRYLDLRPSNFLYWQAIKRAHDHGYRIFDFGRSKWDSGTYRFKRQHGAKAMPIFYQYALHRSESMPQIEPDSPKFRAASAVWRRLPRALVNSLGPRIIRSIP